MTLKQIFFLGLLVIVAIPAAMRVPSYIGNSTSEPRGPESCADPAACEAANEAAYSPERQTEIEAQRVGETFIEKSKARVVSSMRDPASAQFRGVFLSSKAGLPVTCGYVNGRNAFGGYTGFKEFMALSGDTVSINDGSPKFAKAWNVLCSSS